MKACILVKTKSGKHNAVARNASKIAGVKLAFPVLGRTDVVASVEATDIAALQKIALDIGVLRGVVATETLIAMEV